MTVTATTTAPTQVTPAPQAAPAPETAQPQTPPTAEQPPAPEAPKPAEDPRIAARFAALTRKEQAAVQAAAQAKADREAAERARAEAQAIQDKWNGYKGNKAKALEALQELGFTYDDLTQLQLNGGQVTPEMLVEQLREEVNGIKTDREKEREAARNAEVERAKAAAQQAIDGFKAEIAAHVTSDKTAYPLINKFGQSTEVWNLIEGTYLQTCEKDADGNIVKAGQVLSIPEAAKQVEDRIRAQVTQAWEVLNPPQVNPAPTVEQPKPAPSKLVSKPNTLTPSTTPVTTPNKPKRYETEEERFARVVAKYSKKPA